MAEEHSEADGNDATKTLPQDSLMVGGETKDEGLARASNHTTHVPLAGKKTCYAKIPLFSEIDVDDSGYTDGFPKAEALDTATIKMLRRNRGPSEPEKKEEQCKDACKKSILAWVVHLFEQRTALAGSLTDEAGTR